MFLVGSHLPAKDGAGAGWPSWVTLATTFVLVAASSSPLWLRHVLAGPCARAAGLLRPAAGVWVAGTRPFRGRPEWAAWSSCPAGHS